MVFDPPSTPAAAALHKDYTLVNSSGVAKLISQFSDPMTNESRVINILRVAAWLSRGAGLADIL